MSSKSSLYKEIDEKTIINKDDFKTIFDKIKTIIGSEENVNEQITNKGKSLIKLLDRISEDSKKVDNLDNYVDDTNYKEIYTIIKNFRNLKIEKNEKKEPDNFDLYTYLKKLNKNKTNNLEQPNVYNLYTFLQKIAELLLKDKSVLNKSLKHDVYDLVLDLLKKPSESDDSEDKKITTIQKALDIETEPNNVLNFYKNGLLIIGKLTQNEYYKHLFQRLYLIIGDKNKKSVLDVQKKDLSDIDKSKNIYDSKLKPSKQDDYIQFFNTDFIAKLFIMVINKCLREKNYMVPLFEINLEKIAIE